MCARIYNRACIRGVVLSTCLEQDVDGDTLLMLSTTGSIDQLIACGLKTVKQQITLKKLLGSCCSSSVVISSSGGSTA